MPEGWRPNPTPVTAAELAAVLTSNAVVVIHFWATWNGVDREFDPKLARVRAEFEGRIEFRSADVDDPDLLSFCQESEVLNVPALGCFVGGRRIKTIIGSVSDDNLRAEFRRLLPQDAVDEREAPSEVQPTAGVRLKKPWWQFWN